MERSFRWFKYQFAINQCILREFCTKFPINYSSQFIGDEIAALYASLSKSLHEYKSFQSCPGQYVIYAPQDMTQLQLCLLTGIVTSPDAPGMTSVTIKKPLFPESEHLSN